MKMDSLVSVIIPTFNRGYIISETLDCVLAQTYRNWECIIVDDGSVDETDIEVKKYVEKDNRFKYYLRPESKLKGASSCRNYGFELSKGDFIQYLDSDDIISANKLEEQVKLLENVSKDSIAICTWGWFKTGGKQLKVHENLEVYRDFNSPNTFLNALGNSKGYFPPHVYLINRYSIKRTGFWNEYLTINDDGEFMMRLIMNVSHILFSENCSVFYRIGNQDKLSTLDSKKKNVDLLNSWKQIDAIFKIRFKDEELSYIDKIKNNLYKEIYKNYPKLINENRDFFEQQIKSNSLIISFGKRLAIKLNRFGK